jgi:Nucleotidyl transferase AbiEii toxin, Type IV TA system
VKAFEIVNEIGTRGNLPFLLIGGHAVNAYGYSRFTQDMDILIDQDHKSSWLRELGVKGFKLYHDGGAFLQMTPPPNCNPLDLMLVNSATFESLSEGVNRLKISGMNMPVPSLENLFALKLHVLQQEVPNRGYKDFMDILALADCNAVDLHSDKFRELCEKFGNKKIYERILAFKG